MTEYLELYIPRGADYAIDIVVKDEVTTAAVNISGYGITSQVRKSYYSSNSTANLICTVTDASNGTFRLSMNSANTSNINPGRYVYDIITTDTSNSKTRIIEGMANILPSVTR